VNGQGTKLELCGKNRAGLLSDITRIIRENGLIVVRADIATDGGRAVNAFYVRDISGNDVDIKFIESMKRQMSPLDLTVRKEKSLMPSSPNRPRFSIVDFFKSHLKRLYRNFVTIK
jgi:hypothetical protein